MAKAPAVAAVAATARRSVCLLSSFGMFCAVCGVCVCVWSVVQN